MAGKELADKEVREFNEFVRAAPAGADRSQGRVALFDQLHLRRDTDEIFAILHLRGHRQHLQCTISALELKTLPFPLPRPDQIFEIVP